jgi:hypothetical protein
MNRPGLPAETTACPAGGRIKVGCESNEGLEVELDHGVGPVVTLDDLDGALIRQVGIGASWRAQPEGPKILEVLPRKCTIAGRNPLRK